MIDLALAEARSHSATTAENMRIWSCGAGILVIYLAGKSRVWVWIGLSWSILSAASAAALGVLFALQLHRSAISAYDLGYRSAQVFMSVGLATVGIWLGISKLRELSRKWDVYGDEQYPTRRAGDEPRGEQRVAQLLRHRLRVDHSSDLLNPSWDVVRSTLGRIGEAAQVHLVLHNDRDDFVLAAGTRARLAIGCRRTTDGSCNHWLLARHHASGQTEPLDPNGGAPVVLDDEALTVDDAIVVFQRFYQHGDLPDGYSSRLVTAEDPPR